MITSLLDRLSDLMEPGKYHIYGPCMKGLEQRRGKQTYLKRLVVEPKPFRNLSRGNAKTTLEYCSLNTTKRREREENTNMIAFKE